MTDQTQTISTQQTSIPQIAQPEPTPTKVNYKNVKAEMVCSSAPAVRKIKDSDETYKTLPLLYNYGTADRPVLSEFDMEGKKVKCRGGILIKVDAKTGRVTYSVKTSYNVLNDKDIIDAVTIAWKASAREFDKNKGFFGRRKNLVGADGEVDDDSYKCPVYFPRDEATLEIIPGRNPTQFIKLIKYGSGYSAQQTEFSIPVIKPKDPKDPSAGERVDLDAIEWDILYGVDLEIIPVYRFESIYFSSKPSLQCKMASAIVTSMTPNGGADQRDTAQQLVSQDKNLATNLANQLQALRLAYRESGSLPQQPPEQQSQQSNTDSNGNQAGMQTMTTAPPVQPQAQQPPQAQPQQPIQVPQQPTQTVQQPSPPKEAQSLQTILNNQMPTTAPQAQLQVAPPPVATQPTLPQVQVAVAPQTTPPTAAPQITIETGAAPPQIQMPPQAVQVQQVAESWQ